MTDLIQEMQSYYARRAPIYDASMGYDRTDTVTALGPVVETICAELQGLDVLEIACGPGFWTSRLSACVRRTIAMDFNATMLEEARLKSSSLESVLLVAGDAYALPFRNAQFTAAFATDWLAHVPRKRMWDFLEGVHSVLKPEARLVFCDQLPGPHSMGDVNADGDHIQVRELPDGSKHRVIKHFFTDEELRSLFSNFASGVVDITRFPEVRRIVVAYTLPL